MQRTAGHVDDVPRTDVLRVAPWTEQGPLLARSQIEHGHLREFRLVQTANCEQDTATAGQYER
jgi:hypothetical protein